MRPKSTLVGSHISFPSRIIFELSHLIRMKSEKFRELFTRFDTMKLQFPCLSYIEYSNSDSIETTDLIGVLTS